MKARMNRQGGGGHLDESKRRTRKDGLFRVGCFLEAKQIH